MIHIINIFTLIGLLFLFVFIGFCTTTSPHVRLQQRLATLTFYTSAILVLYTIGAIIGTFLL